MQASPLIISIPSWGKDYVRLAVDCMLPSVFASLDKAGIEDVIFHVFTDDASAFAGALRGRVTAFFPLPMFADPWARFSYAHRQSIEEAPEGAILALLNSDLVFSVETFGLAMDLLSDPRRKVIATIGIRSRFDKGDAPPPIGASSHTLADWIWEHKHSITEECIWEKGATVHPSILFFEDNAGVAMRGFHLTPYFLRKTSGLSFSGTIDDDLLANYADEEIIYATEPRWMIAELSPSSKRHATRAQLSVEYVVDFGLSRLPKAQPRFKPCHVRNFRYSFTIMGQPSHEHVDVERILKGLECIS